MQSIQALRERRAVLAKETRDLLDAHPGDKWGAPQQEKYDAAIKELDVIDAEAGRIAAMLERTADDNAEALARQAVDKAAKDSANPAIRMFDKWLRGGDKALTAAEWADIRATMSTTTNSQGGYTVPTQVSKQLIDSLKAFGGMRAVSDVFSTEGFGDLNYPTSDGTAEVGELIGQNTTATGADPSFNVVTITAYKYSSKIVAVPYELLQDTTIDMEAFILKRLGQRLGRITNTHFTTGTGSGQPNGVVTAATAGPTAATGNTTSMPFVSLVDLVHSLDPAYRAGGACRFMMSDSALKAVRKLVDSQNRPIFLPGYDGLGGSMGDMLLGYPITINQDVAVPAANAKSILFGDFSYYKIRDVMAVQMFRFEDSAYAKLGQVGYLAWMRAGGNLVDAKAIYYAANSAT